jgi:hypothetical protein
MVADTCKFLATQEMEIGRIMVWDKPEEKVRKTLSSTKKLGLEEYAYHSSYVGGLSRKIMVQAGLCRILRSYLKNI